MRINTNDWAHQNRGKRGTYLFLNLLRAAQHQVYYVGFNSDTVRLTDLIRLIFNLKKDTSNKNYKTICLG